MKVLITAPSLDEHKNVSGISTLVSQIIKHGQPDFYHFEAGRRDGENINADWIFRQTLLTPHFTNTIRREKIDLVHINTALVPFSIVRDAALVGAARLMKLPILLHLHGGRFLMEDFSSKILAKITGKMFRAADKIIVLSEHEKESLERRWTNLSIEVLPNAVEVDNVPKTERESKSEKTIIFLGRMHESKGLHEIIEACRALRNENFQFVFRCFGAGALKDFFVAEMSEILGDKFYYGGVIAGEKKWRELAASDIFLLPSRYGEGLPLAILEAMAAGNVVIAADVASVRAVIDDGENGLMVEPYNTAQIIEKLKFLLSDRADCKTLRRNARTTIEDKFDIGKYIVNLEKIYAEIVSRRTQNQER